MEICLHVFQKILRNQSKKKLVLILMKFFFSYISDNSKKKINLVEKMFFGEKKLCYGGSAPLNHLGSWGFLVSHTHCWGLHPQTPNPFGWNHPSQLVIGYHWLVFLNQVCKNMRPRNLNENIVKQKY